MPPTKANGRFELPQLTPVNISLTDGTNIPPPLPSPVGERPPPPSVSKSADTENIAPKLNGSATKTNGVNGALNANYQREPLSPASSKRPGSIRRFLSRKSLNSNYVHGTNTNISNEDLGRIARPDSSMSFAPSHAKKRSVSWFRRLGSAKRTSIVYEEKLSVPPPAPKLPELNQLEAKIPNDEGSLGADDLFKNIK